MAKMNWDTVGAYPIACYTTFLDHNKFRVDVVKGVKNATKNHFSHITPVWFSFESEGVAAHHEAAKQGFIMAAIKLKEKKEMHKRSERVTQVTPKPEPVVWAASVFTPDRKWNEVYMSVDRQEVCTKGRECAIRHRRCVKIHQFNLVVNLSG